MSGIVHLLVGKRKTGKTTYSKSLLKLNNLNKKIYDINNEYNEFYSEPFIDFETFLNECIELKNTYLLFEEATIFFDSRKTSDIMKNLLVRSRHTNNIIQLNFHSFSSIPKYIKNLIDFITIFKTGDTLKDVKEKFDNEKIIAGFLKIKNSENPFDKITISLM